MLLILNICLLLRIPAGIPLIPLIPSGHTYSYSLGVIIYKLSDFLA